MAYTHDHVDRLIDRLSYHLRRTLFQPQNMAKPHWQTMTLEQLDSRLLEAYEEMVEAIRERQSPDRMWDKCAEVVFFLLAQADVYEAKQEIVEQEG